MAGEKLHLQVRLWCFYGMVPPTPSRQLGGNGQCQQRTSVIVPHTAVSDAPFVCVDTPRPLILLSLLVLTHGYNRCVPVALSQAEETYCLC